MRFSSLVTLALSFCITIGARAQQGATRITSVEGITEYRLPNGLRVLLFPDQSKPTVTVNVTYMVGSRHEGYGETGMAHLLEHMQFKGTATRHDIPEELDKHGARWNASTWFDRTNYFETMTASPENLSWALGLEADRMTHSLIAEKDRSSEMTVVRNEFERGENSPQSILRERVTIRLKNGRSGSDSNASVNPPSISDAIWRKPSGRSPNASAPHSSPR